MMKMTDYVLEYCNKVVHGEIVACQKIKQACRRELNDRKRDNFEYHFDNKKSYKAIKFMELIPSPTGEPIKLALFQKWIIGELYGWRDMNGNRRYHNAFISLSRKNGKSFLSSCIEIATLLLENKPARNRQILNVANNFSQATLAFNMARSNLNHLCTISPSLRKRLNVRKKEIYDTKTDSFIEPLPSADTSRLDGYNPCLAVIDEYHGAKNHDVVNVLKSGQGQQDNALLCIISTSGFNLKGAMYQDYKTYTDVLNGKNSLDDTFIAIYEQDNENEVYNATTWIKSNPLFEVDSIRNKMSKKIHEDIKSALIQNDSNPVLVKNFNLWRANSENTFLKLDDWQKTEVEPIDIKNKKVVFGIDLSKANDLTSVSWIIPTDDGRYFTDSHSWVGTKFGLIEKEKQDEVNYTSLADAGYCTITDLQSGVIDYDQIFNFIKNMVDRNNLDVLGICYDPWSFGYLLGEFEKENYPLIETSQGAKNLNFSEKQFREYVFNNQIVHPKNPLLDIAVINSIWRSSSAGVGFIDKTRYSNRIDPLVSIQFAWKFVSDQLLNKEEKSNKYYENFSF